MIKKKSRKRRSSHFSPRHSSQLPSVTVRRFGVALVAAAIVAFQTTSCSLQPTAFGPRTERGHAATYPRFAACPQLFANGSVPLTEWYPPARGFRGAAQRQHPDSRLCCRALEPAVADAGPRARAYQQVFCNARLPQSERAELSDYKGSGYARGHMAPAADMFNPTAMAQSFSLANMVRQNPKQNSGAWAKIEEDIRAYAMRAHGDVYVITGPVYALGSATIGVNQVHVPTHLFKLVYDATTQRAWAHWQQNSPEARLGPPISYGELEQRTGMEWLPGEALK